MLSLWSCSSRKWSICINSYSIRHFLFWEYQKDPQFVKLQMFRRERVQELRSLWSAGGALCFALLTYCSKNHWATSLKKKLTQQRKNWRYWWDFPFDLTESGYFHVFCRLTWISKIKPFRVREQRMWILNKPRWNVRRRVGTLNILWQKSLMKKVFEWIKQFRYQGKYKYMINKN